jgi:hypothetical protein
MSGVEEMRGIALCAHCYTEQRIQFKVARGHPLPAAMVTECPGCKANMIFSPRAASTQARGTTYDALPPPSNYGKGRTRA